LKKIITFVKITLEKSIYNMKNVAESFQFLMFALCSTPCLVFLPTTYSGQFAKTQVSAGFSGGF
jgi:hypothetical protein